MSDLYFQQLSTVGSNSELQAATIASTTTIAPTTYLTFLSGTTNVATITPPTTGWCQIAIVWTNASPGQFVTTGNISVGSTTMAQNKLNILVYDPISVKWYVNAA